MIDRYRRWFGRVAGTHLARTMIGPKVVARLDRVLFRRLHGSIISLGSRAFPTLLLTTRGRKTGRPHTVPLLYLQQADRLVVVASNYGRDRHPGWSFNLLASGSARVEINGEVADARARLLSALEKEAVWPDLLDLFETWKRYEAETERDLRVFELRFTDR